ncbi:recombinase family protein [Micromonospora avicenniae]|uniref:Site-specific DNA recombinase n=1 Tax=Micromonospora avicenniae TaxID=1198245 RepID=A0A1N7CPC9_9ACTN|nr:recombinase family protein [Micromonospora avicenniae]SIR65284.1 Site-specific DNA recombinase [Micromonospora avicenniae]
MSESLQERAGVYGRQSVGKRKSILEQLAAGEETVREEGWTLAGTYEDGTSASRYGTKPRGGWAKVLEDIEAGRLDVLVLWESSRGDRTPETWFAFLSSCRSKGVKIHVITHERTYNLDNARDWKSLAEEGVSNAYESEVLSIRTRRGVAASAKSGRPPMGRPVYGYRRVYDSRTGELLGQEPDPATAPIARSIIEQVARSVPISVIARDLNDRGVPAPYGANWYRQRIRDMATNPAYVGLRKHKEETYRADWEPIVSEQVFYAAQRILNEPTRLSQARPGRQKHLLTYLATCPEGDPMTGKDQTDYACRRGHISIRREPVDRLVTELVLGRLAMPDIYDRMRRAGESADREVTEARNKAAELRARLDEFRRSAIRGETTPATLAFAEAELAAQIEAEEARAASASLPVALREFAGPPEDVRARWEAAPLAARRTVIRTLMKIVIIPTQRAYLPAHQRVKVTWL